MHYQVSLSYTTHSGKCVHLQHFPLCLRDSLSVLIWTTSCSFADLLAHNAKHVRAALSLYPVFAQSHFRSDL